MPWKWGGPYQYNLAEWLGVFFALIGTPPFIYEAFGIFGSVPTWLVAVWGGIAVVGWTLLVLGTLAHQRAVSRTST